MLPARGGKNKNRQLEHDGTRTVLGVPSGLFPNGREQGQGGLVHCSPAVLRTAQCTEQALSKYLTNRMIVI